MGLMLDTIGKLIAGYLQKEVPGYEPFTPSDPERLREIVQPGDVILVEGNNRVSGIIKYLTQSTWSHAALYVGELPGPKSPSPGTPMLIEMDLVQGCIAVGDALGWVGGHWAVMRSRPTFRALMAALNGLTDWRIEINSIRAGRLPSDAPRAFV